MGIPSGLEQSIAQEFSKLRRHTSRSCELYIQDQAVNDHKPIPAMNTKHTLKTEEDEQTFSSALVIILLLLLPLLGGGAMLIGSAIGLLAYVVLFRERLGSCGWKKTLITAIVAAVVVAAIALTTAAGAAQERDPKAKERI